MMDDAESRPMQCPKSMPHPYGNRFGSSDHGHDPPIMIHVLVSSDKLGTGRITGEFQLPAG
jgi:hypothetical protein